jgi:hypothetical protein
MALIFSPARLDELEDEFLVLTRQAGQGRQRVKSLNLGGAFFAMKPLHREFATAAGACDG